MPACMPSQGGTGPASPYPAHNVQGFDNSSQYYTTVPPGQPPPMHSVLGIPVMDQVTTDEGAWCGGMGGT